jgi:methylthioribulose-1-phosphate dehydratase
VPATSGNFSARCQDGRIAITVSGRHKGFLTRDDIMAMDLSGRLLEDKRPSAETLLHLELYRRYARTNVVLHTHSVGATVLSRLVGEGGLEFDGYEVLKAFRGVTSHENRLTLPVFANDQDMERLSAAVAKVLDRQDDLPGYLIAGHGLYAWGENMAETMRHLEAFEFLFQCELETRRINRS